MAVTETPTSASLGIRIRNGQTTTGEWRYKTVSITGVRDDFGTQNDDYSKALGLYDVITPILVGTADGMRVSRISSIVESA